MRDRLFTRRREHRARSRRAAHRSSAGPTNLEFARVAIANEDARRDARPSIGMGQRMVRTADGAAGLWGATVSGNTFELLGARAHARAAR